MQHLEFDPAIADAWHNLIVPQLSPDNMLTGMLVSRSWCTLYQNPILWKKAIETHFGIANELLNQFENIAFNIAGISHIDYKLLYKRLYFLFKADKHKEIFKNPDHHLSLLTCCLDNAAVAKRVLSHEHNHIWRKSVIAVDCANIFIEIFYPERHFYVSEALQSANAFAITQRFVVEKLPTICRESTYFLETQLHVIFLEGNFSTIQYLIDHRDLFGFKMDKFVFDRLFENKRIPLQYICDLKASAAPFIKVSSDAIIRLINNGYFEYAKYLISTNQVQLPLNSYIIQSLSSANLLTPTHLDFLFNPSNPWALPQNDESLEGIIKSEHEILVFLLNPENGYQFVLTSIIFEYAVSAGNPKTMQYLLEHHTSPTCMPHSWALELAMRFRSVGMARQLLDFGIKPTLSHLYEAINSNLVEIVKLLMAEDRQYGLKLTEQHLKMALESRLHLGIHEEPQLELIKFILEPRFGLHMTKRLFVQMHTSFSRTEYYNKTDVILFLLEDSALKLTQEKFEQLFCGARLFAIANLLIQHPVRFSHLKPSRRMLRMAIEIKSKIYIEYFLQPRFGLEVDAHDLSYALSIKDEEIFDLMLSKATCHFVPTQASIVDLLRDGHIQFAQRLLDAYPIAGLDITRLDFLLNQLFTFSNAEGLAFGLALVKGSGLLGPDKPKQRVGVSVYSLAHHEHLLDPQYHISFQLTDTNESVNRSTQMILDDIPSIGFLVKSDIAIKAALNNLQLDLTLAIQQFDQACKLSPRQCFRVAMYAFSHPAEFYLDVDAQHQLLSLMQKALSNLDQFSIADLIVINKHLLNAKNILRTGKEEKLADQLSLIGIQEYLDILTSRHSEHKPRYE